MSDYGVKGSTPGYDVKNVIDYLQQFNSSWPLLKIHDTQTFSGTVTHNLGYPPFFFIAEETDGRLGQFSFAFSIDSTTLSRNIGARTPRYFICRQPLNENFTASTPPGTTIVATDNDDYGFKVARPGASVDSTDMRDFALHSSTRSPMIQLIDHAAMSNTGGGLGYERTVPHGFTYTPIAFAFINPGANPYGVDAGRYTLLPPGPTGVVGAYYTVDSTNVYVTADNINYVTPPDISVVVLKEPFEKEAVSITFP